MQTRPEINCKVLICTFIILLLSQSCTVQKKLENVDCCATKYPIVLVHGVAFRDDFPVIKYWSHLPKVLEEKGARIYLANQNAFNSHAENAMQLRKRIIQILDETGANKVNIIAHSKGGIESRYMITKLDMADKVASLTTLATPHRGSYIADTILIFLHHIHRTKEVVSLVNAYARLIGDKDPDSYTAAINLTQGYMEKFNRDVPNMAQVYYQSIGGIISDDYPLKLVKFQHKILCEKEGENDGIVSLKSYQWGNFRGIVKSNQDFGVSHFDIVGMKFINRQSTFNAEAFFIKIVNDLKEKGF